MNQAAGILRPHQGELAFVYRLIDVVVIGAALWLGIAVRGLSWSQDYVLAGLIGIVVFYICAQGNGVYNSWRTSSFKESTKPLLLSWLMTMFVMLFIAYATKTTSGFSRVAIGTWMVVVPIALVLWRLIFRSLIRRMRAKGYNTRTVAIAGITYRGRQLARIIRAAPDTGMRIAGFFEVSGRSESMLESSEPRIRGSLEDLVTQAKDGNIDIVYVALTAQDEPATRKLLVGLSDTTASVYFVPDFMSLDLLHSRWSTVGNLPVVSVFETPFHGIDGWTKRCEDVVLSLIILVLAAGPMLAIAASIWLTSGRPILFKQDRYGLAGKRIKVWKFRTMKVCENDEVLVQATRNDERVTRIGAILRRTSLDELPQFFNVLAGSMSIVGPRPHAVTHNEEYRRLILGYMLRHKVKPGITGWAQINNYRGETDTLEKMEKRIEYDLWYIRNWSFLLDLKLMLFTLVHCVRGKQAY